MQTLVDLTFSYLRRSAVPEFAQDFALNELKMKLGTLKYKSLSNSGRLGQPHTDAHAEQSGKQ